MQEAHTVSHFQRAVLKIGDYLIVLAVALVAVIITVALFRGDPILTTLQFALVLTVAAIPVAMPTVLSVTMAVGARLLASKQAIVTRLAAIEELAGVDVLCADKTGTLTQNKLTLGDPFSVNGVTAEQVILYAALASRADNKDTIDLAVLGGLKNDQALKAYQVSHFQPFDPVHKRTEATVKGADGKEFKSRRVRPRSSWNCRPMPERSSPPSTRRSTNSRRAAFARWAWRAPTRTANGSFWACCRCSIRRATMPRPPLRPRGRWACGSRW